MKQPLEITGKGTGALSPGPLVSVRAVEVRRTPPTIVSSSGVNQLYSSCLRAAQIFTKRSQATPRR